ncbi:hypothetical protein [Frankia sp. AgKG'84/4]|uniref:hypothetical protein n=1 Tax=Frankia sp. AgKG'84/4 TaxID=573490 RepID=UPI00200C29A1|nr:hypothetical protein [Frankia sp. AgKG'84/4]MCL9793645.1 hypothetical protein [Frankia sp. AgKG'84/4]
MVSSITRGRAACAAGAVVVTAAAAVWSRHEPSAPMLPASWGRWGQQGGPPPLSPARLLDTWQLDAVALAYLVPVTCLYLWGVARVRARHPVRPWPRSRSASTSVPGPSPRTKDDHRGWCPP